MSNLCAGQAVPKSCGWLWLPIGLLLVFVAGCGWNEREPAQAVVTSKNLERVHGKPWSLRAITIDGSNVVMHVDALMAIRFDPDGQARGYGGVSQFSRGYAFDDGGALKWTTPDFALQRKSGPPELRDKEQVYLDALKQVTRGIAGKKSLTLQSEDGSTLLTYVSPDAM